MGRQQIKPGASSQKSIKARLEESIVWVAIGIFIIGLSLGLTLAKDSTIFQWIERANQKGHLAVQGNSPYAQMTNGPNIGLPDGERLFYRQTESFGGQPNCLTCILTSVRIANDLVYFSTNNGLRGSAYFEKRTGHWKGHAQFRGGDQYWDYIIIFVDMEITLDTVKIIFTPINRASWEARYTKQS